MTDMGLDIYEKIFNSLNVGVFLYTTNKKDMQFVKVNKFGCELFRFEDESSFLAHDWTLPQVCHPDEVEYLMNEMLHLNAVGDLVDHEYHLNRRNGTFIWVNCYQSVIAVEGDRLTILNSCTVIDKEKRAEEANAAKTQFLSNMSHDMRTPLNAIMNLTSLLNDELEDPVKLKDDIAKIEVACEFLQQLIDDVLDVSLIESGHIKLSPTVYTYATFLNYIRGIISPLCADKDITFVLDEGPTAFDIYMDRARFHQVFFNILSNAVKYTPPGGTVMFRTCNNVVHDGVLTCDFVISDTGCGMSAETMEHAFEPFVRGDSTEAYVGSGLGLAICKRILDLMGATISIESELGKGTTITVHMDLPIATEKQRTERQAELDTSYARNIEAVQVRECRILVVEDNEINAEILLRLLEKMEMQAERVCNGQEAIDAISSHAADYYQLILMDIRMPVLDGISAARLIRQEADRQKANIPIIAVTANAFENDALECRAAGMNGCLAKPIAPHKLQEALATYIKLER